MSPDGDVVLTAEDDDGIRRPACVNAVRNAASKKLTCHFAVWAFVCAIKSPNAGINLKILGVAYEIEAISDNPYL